MKPPPFDIFPTISGDKILLREIQDAELNDLIDISFYDGVKAANLQQVTAMQKKIKKDHDQGNSIHWGIVDNASNEIVGTCGFYRGFDKEAGELGCILLPQFRGKGFMTAALLLAIDFGLNNIGLQRIWAITTTENYQARKLLDRLGFIELKALSDDEIEYEYRH